MGVTFTATYSTANTGDVPYTEVSPHTAHCHSISSHVPHLLKEAEGASESPFVPSGNPVQRHNRVFGHEF